MSDSSHSFRSHSRSRSPSSARPSSKRPSLWRTLLWWTLAALAAFVLLEVTPAHAAPQNLCAPVR